MEKQLLDLNIQVPVERQDIPGEPMPDLNILASYQTQFHKNCSELLDFLYWCGSDGLDMGSRGKRDGSSLGVPGRRTRLKMAPVSGQGDSTIEQQSDTDMVCVPEAAGNDEGDSATKPLLDTSLFCTTEPSGNNEGGSAEKLQLDSSLSLGLTDASSIGEGDSATKQPSDTLMMEATSSPERDSPTEQLLPLRTRSILAMVEASRISEESLFIDVTMEASRISEDPLLIGLEASRFSEDPLLLIGLSVAESSDSREGGGSATKHVRGSELFWSLPSSNGEGTQQPPDGSLVCRLKDVACLLLSYSISITGTDRALIYEWIRNVLKLISQCRLAMVGLYDGRFKINDSALTSLGALEEIKFYLPYWYPSPSKEPGEILTYDPLGATLESVDLAVESAVAQLKTCFVEKIQEDIKLIAITGEGAKKVTSSLKDSGYVEDMFDHVISITVSKEWNILDVHNEIRQQLGQQMDMFKPAVKDIVILLDDVHDRMNLLEWRPPSSFRYVSGVFLHFKVVVTRSQSVAQPLAVDLEIRMGDHLVPWSVFSRNVGQILHTSTAIQSIAASIIKRCQAHILAITVLARALRGIADTDVWEDALYHLAGYSTDTQTAMINALKFCLSRKNRVTRQYIRRYIHNASKSIVHPPELMSAEEDRVENDLVDAFLLQRSEDGKGLIMEKQIHQILLNSSLLDACEMLDDGESNATKIELVNRGIYQLPQSPSCPMLTVLFLQMNSDLTLIPSSFFRHMPCLQALNLSNTSISSLPESLFQLSSLEKLCLKDCELFMVLPPQIKELKNLKELDLQGTALVNLPREIGELKKLTCLKVSFHGDLDFNGEYPSETMIPTGVLSELSMLMTLSIDVNPADKRWDKAVKVVIGEIRSLEQLESLEMYLPEVTLLEELTSNLPSLIQDSAIKFRLTVGRHQRQIMSRVPRGVEGRFRNLERCLKYVNGNEGNSNISSPIMDVLKYSDSFFLNRHFTITDLTKLGIGNLKKLRFCVLGENDKLVTIMKGKDAYEGTEERHDVLPALEEFIIYRMKNMRSICQGPLQNVRSMRKLKSLILNGCPRLEVVFTPSLLKALHCLKDIIIEDCPAISSLVTEDIDGTKVLKMQHIRPWVQLKNISLHHLPELKSIFSGLNIVKDVERVSIYDCPNLDSLPAKRFFSPRSKVFRGEKHWLLSLDREGHARRVFVPFRRDSHFKTQLAADGFNF